jgi:crotonobetainyl-CoA:carnitine CoA-transferase CaiB-like acyl-CoA transferase
VFALSFATVFTCSLISKWNHDRHIPLPLFVSGEVTMDIGVGVKRTGPCAGLTVLDLSTMISGPMAGQILGDLGADVIKLEAVEGDTLRAVRPHHKGLGAYFSQYNRSKQSIAVDLKSDEGRQLARDLARKADILIENFRPGVSERLGLGYEDVSNGNPALIYLSIKGFGEDGPYRDQPAYDMVIQALVGFMPFQGEAGNPEPIRNAVVDKVAAMSGAMSVLAALVERGCNGGRGQKVIVKMLDAWAAFVSQEVMKNHTFSDPGVEPHGNRNPYRVFDTSDGKVMGFILQDNQFRGICAALSRVELLVDPRFATPGDRLANVEAMYDELGSSISELTTEEFLARTRKNEVPMARVNSFEQFLDDPQARHNRIVQTLVDPELGDISTLNFYATFGRTPVELNVRAPKLGEHTDEILRLAGRTADEINSLKQSKAVR